jgi:hypothetical protein
VIQHLVIDGQVACFDRQQSVEDTTTSDNSTVHEVLVVKRAWKTSELAEKREALKDCGEQQAARYGRV